MIRLEPRLKLHKNPYKARFNANSSFNIVNTSDTEALIFEYAFIYFLWYCFYQILQ